MSPALLPRYLFGSREAILALAAHRWTPAVGVLLCLSAGLARSYDGEDLAAEPWHVLRPLAAALVGATLLFGLLRLVAPDRTKPHPDAGWSHRASLLGFAGLYLCTAPMAWLYAVPFERFLDPLAAAEANLWLLGFVAAWRVLLMTRVASVLWAMHPLGAFAAVMLFADAVVLFVLMFLDAPVIDVMGGLRLEDRERLVNEVKIIVLFWGLLTSPLWLLGTLGYARQGSPEPAFPVREPASAPRLALGLAALSILAWAPALVFTQPEQHARTRLEHLFDEGDAAGAVGFMSARTPADFPPGWSPPPSGPRRFRWSDGPLLSPVERTILEGGAAPWVAAVYAERAEARLRDSLVTFNEGWKSVWSHREAHPANADPVTFEQAEAATFVLHHAPDLDDETSAALRRVLAEAPAAPRTVDEDASET